MGYGAFQDVKHNFFIQNVEDITETVSKKGPGEITAPSLGRRHSEAVIA